MTEQHSASVVGGILRVTAWALALVCALAMGAAQAQTYTVIHTFTGGNDGGNPYGGVTVDQAGNLYGAAYFGGDASCNPPWGCGVVFKLAHGNSGWTLAPLHNFRPGDGSFPQSQPVFGPDGALYGTTSNGGSANEGTVYSLRPPVSTCHSFSCPWTETLIYQFGGGGAGSYPAYGSVVFDQAGNLYGTTMTGGSGFCTTTTCGTVYELVRSTHWSERILYNFSPGDLGHWPLLGLTIDGSGNLYGATTYDFGSVFEVTQSGGGWLETTLHNFSRESAFNPVGGLTFDASGNLYGTTSTGGPGGAGTVFELTPTGGGWTYTTIHTFDYSGAITPPGPTSKLTIDAAGNLYGTTYAAGGDNLGSVFRLSRSGGGWTYTSLHDFTGDADGNEPWGQVTFAPNGKIYGTVTAGGMSAGCYWGGGCGVVFEITP